MKSKLIVNTGTLSAGGAERVLSILSKTFTDVFDEVQYVMWLDAKYPDIFYDIDPRVKIIRMSKVCGSTKTWRQMIWYRQYVKQEKPDLVLSFMVMVCFTVTITLAFTGIKQVVAERNDPRHFSRKWLRGFVNLSYCLPDVKGIIMQTERNRFYFTNGLLLRKTKVIYNPIEINNNLIGRGFVTSKERVIVSVGRLAAQKQQDILLMAFAKFCQTHNDYQLIIYGEGDERSKLMKIAKQLNIAERVSLPGRQNDILIKILSARMFVLTSKYEGMSNALAEAMCVGLPCISTNVSGATDLIKDGVNGFITEIGDVDAIASRMCLLADDDNLCKMLGQEASNIYQFLSYNVVNEKWVDFLETIIKS